MFPTIHDHTYRPTPEFLGKPKDNIFLGVELELDIVGYDRDDGPTTLRVAKAAQAILGDFIYFKHDGSIRGVELVTKPAALSIHRKRWKEFFEGIPDKFVANERDGLHVHVSKSPLGLTQQWAIHDFVTMPQHENFVVEIAGRNFTNYSKKIRKSPSEMGIYPSSKYEAINTRPEETVEFRLFAATTDYNKFMTRVEFAAALTHLALTVKTQKSITLDQLRDWVGERPKYYPALASYLEAKR